MPRKTVHDPRWEPYSALVKLYLTPSQRHDLDQLVVELRVSRSALLRQAIDAGLRSVVPELRARRRSRLRPGGTRAPRSRMRIEAGWLAASVCLLLSKRAIPDSLMFPAFYRIGQSGASRRSFLPCRGEGLGWASRSFGRFIRPLISHGAHRRPWSYQLRGAPRPPSRRALHGEIRSPAAAASVAGSCLVACRLVGRVAARRPGRGWGAHRRAAVEGSSDRWF